MIGVVSHFNVVFDDCLNMFGEEIPSNLFSLKK